ncbi:hypothetical protein C2E20_8640 isoform A [Micractinium conductrix]|uniref:Uncharacterized protein n=1 Tax=Micractinium conductrix TaxID=554055 RepID=A0A2P6V0T3_9CHLO|nr:hypothetical protein C2E20_8640 isoform A [Micractinium conductrix]|eukprot:PSC67702.1 hypothetical protein C2E20_8640 isoform A [Micractinium conductrix]
MAPRPPEGAVSVRVCCPCSDSRCFSASGVCEEIIPEFYLKTAADAVNAALSRSGRSERLPTHAGQTVSPLLLFETKVVVGGKENFVSVHLRISKQQKGNVKAHVRMAHGDGALAALVRKQAGYGGSILVDAGAVAPQLQPEEEEEEEEVQPHQGAQLPPEQQQAEQQQQLLQRTAQGAEEREGSVSFAMQTDNPGVRSDGEEPGAKRRKQPLRMGRPAARALREPSPSLTTGFNSLSSGRADGAASASRMRSSNSGAEQVADRAVLQQRLARPLALLLQAGWQSHTLDSMFLRAAGLAAKQLDSLQQQEASLAVEASWLAGHSAQHAARVAAAAERAGAAARQLEAARQAALQAYYKPQGSAAADSVDGARGVGGSGASAASWSAHLSAALRRSLQKHPPPARCDELAAAAPAPSPGVQFAPLSSARVPGLGLQRKSDAAGLSSSTCSQLGKLPARPALPDAHARLLLSGGVHGSVLCEIKWRLHPVRLLTPPCSVAHSVNAAPEGPRPAPGEGVGVYVGRMSELDPNPLRDTVYIFEVHQEEIGPAPGEYCGPAIENDGEQWRNETAYINCVFGSDRRPNVRAQPIWDPSGKLPHMLLEYCGAQQAQPLEELLLFYGAAYWDARRLESMREGHCQFAARAAEVVATLLAALEAAGAQLADIIDCLAPVDLTSPEHCFYRRAAGPRQ